MLSLVEFQSRCREARCSRRTFVTKQCEKSTKQERCFKKWVDKQEKKQLAIERGDYIDKKWEGVRREVWLRDTKCEPVTLLNVKGSDWMQYCTLWNSLTALQQNYITNTYLNELWLNNYLDCAHIFPKDLHPELKYDIDNITLVGRYFHHLLDDFKDPITKISIDKETRLNYLLKARGL
jgi:hypothetical protein